MRWFGVRSSWVAGGGLGLGFHNHSPSVPESAAARTPQMTSYRTQAGLEYGVEHTYTQPKS
jgi:hypothetical protein